MDPLPLADLLGRLCYLRRCPGPLLFALAQRCRRVALARGETLFLQGTAADAFFVVEAGAISVVRRDGEGRERVLRAFRAGQSFAEAAAFSFARYPVHARARVTPTRVVVVPKAAFRTLLAADPQVHAALTGTLCGRLLALVERLDTTRGGDARMRLARHLLRQPALCAGEGCLRFAYAGTKKDMAAELDMRPETLSRALAWLRGRGWIVVEGRTWILRRPDRLAEVAGEAGEADLDADQGTRVPQRLRSAPPTRLRRQMP